MPNLLRIDVEFMDVLKLPSSDTVKQTHLPCRLEAAFFERLFDHRTARVSYIPDGHAACTYEFPAEEARAALAVLSAGKS